MIYIVTRKLHFRKNYVFFNLEVLRINNSSLMMKSINL